MSDPNAKTRTRQALILGTAVLGILALIGAGMFMFDGPAKPRREKPRQVSLTPPGTIEDKDAWRAQQAAKAAAGEKALTELQQKLRSQQQTTEQLAKELEALKSGKANSSSAAASAPPRTQMSAEAAAKALDKPLPVSTNPQRVLSPPHGGVAGRSGPAPLGPLNRPLNGEAEKAPPREDVEMITFKTGATSDPTAPSGPRLAPRDATRSDQGTARGREFLPAGSFVRVAMLNGVDAPTGGQAQSNPLPIAFHVLNVANLASRHRLDIKDCRFIAAAWGDLSSERTMARTETLTCIIDGETVEIPVKGQVIGEDGKAGIRGRLVTKQGQVLLNGLLAGGLAGIGRAFQSAATTTTAGGGGITQTIDPDKVAQAGLGGGVSTAANSLAQYYIKAADKLFPVIETDGGRTVEILITKGAVYDAGGRSRDPHRGLLERDGGGARSNDE